MSIRYRVVIPLPAPVVDIVIPVRNRERDVERAVRGLHAFVSERLPLSTAITIADRASTDATTDIAARIASELSLVRVVRLNQKARARALAAAWLTSDARIVAAMDMDRAPDPANVARLIASVVAGRSQISYMPGFQVLRSDVARRLIPRVVSRGRLFDAELALRAAQSSISTTFATRRRAFYAN